MIRGLLGRFSEAIKTLFGRFSEKPPGGLKLIQREVFQKSYRRFFFEMLPTFFWCISLDVLENLPTLSETQF